MSNHWFQKRRGLALGILTASTATGQLILLPVLATIINNHSWRWAMGLISILSIIMLIVIFLFMKNSPKEVDLLPYGLEEGQPNRIESSKGNPIRLAFNGLFAAVKVKEFWLLAGSFFICGFSTSGLIGTHFISYCMGFGIPLVTAASILSFMGLFNLVGTTLSGWLSDRFDNRWLLFWYYILRGASLVLLPFALMEGFCCLFCRYLQYFTVWTGLPLYHLLLGLQDKSLGYIKAALFTAGFLHLIRRELLQPLMVEALSINFLTHTHGPSF